MSLIPNLGLGKPNLGLTGLNWAGLSIFPSSLTRLEGKRRKLLADKIPDSIDPSKSYDPAKKPILTTCRLCRLDYNFCLLPNCYCRDSMIDHWLRYHPAQWRLAFGSIQYRLHHDNVENSGTTRCTICQLDHVCCILRHCHCKSIAHWIDNHPSAWTKVLMSIQYWIDNW